VDENGVNVKTVIRWTWRTLMDCDNLDKTHNDTGVTSDQHFSHQYLNRVNTVVFPTETI